MLKDKLLRWLNLFLVANTFFVFLSFIWLLVAVAGKAADVPLGLDLWFALWNPLFQPSIGILMAGAIASGVISWLAKRFPTNQPNA